MDYININNVKISAIQGDITKLEVDAIVNAANSALRGGGGVDGAIHRAGGRQILEECKKYDGCPTGEARITTAGRMPSKYVVHTVGPIYRGGNNNEAKLLYSAYQSSLALAVENNIKTIAFPFISAGVYGYPKDEASDIAIKSVIDFVKNNKHDFKEITFVLFSEKDYLLYKEKLNEVD